MTRAAALALTVLVFAGGCRTLTGRSPGQWVDDVAVTATVKKRLASERALTLTRIHVDTYEGVVYLTGGVESVEAKRRAEAIAREVPAVRQVVNNLHVAEALAASPATAGRAPRADPLRTRFPGLARLDLESGTPGWTRYAAYDARGRRVATVYVVTDDAAPAFGDLRADGLVIDHVGLYPSAAAPSHVVLWHVAPDEVARLR